MTEKVFIVFFLLAIVALFLGDWGSDIGRGRPSVDFPRNYPRMTGWIPEGVELKQTECGYCFVRPAE